MQTMYYGSYSLPTYVTVWNAEAFLLTTLVPVIIMLVVNYGVLRQIEAVTVEIPAQGSSSGRKQKKAFIFESEDENLFQIPASGDFSEYE